MASLIRKLFETMPLAAISGSMGSQVTIKNATPAQFKHVASGIKEFQGVASSAPRASTPTDGENEPIWGWRIDRRNLSKVESVTCRNHEDNYNRYAVLDSIQWGCAPDKSIHDFRPSVLVELDGAQIELPLSDMFHVISFFTKGCQQKEGGHPMWPLVAKYDHSFVHAFVYDVPRGSGIPIAPSAPTHPDGPSFDKMAKMMVGLSSTADFGGSISAQDFLFDDNLWPDDTTDGLPVGKAPETVRLKASATRILVACCLTTCKERFDFQPGRPAGAARIYPHIMVLASRRLAKIDTAIRFQRPSATTIMDGSKCSICNEMLPPVQTLLVADSNAGAMPLDNVGNSPHPLLANLFSYYCISPETDSDLNNKPLLLVRDDRPDVRIANQMVSRDCSDVTQFRAPSNERKIIKLPRQGWFDNIHISPHMTVRDSIVSARRHDTTEPFTSYATWKMDNVAMAPFCAHDCFHVHWRWSDNANTESSTFGFDDMRPYAVAGAPMVPANQTVSLLLENSHAFTYIATATGVEPHTWQPFMHHGGAYGTATGIKTLLARIDSSVFTGAKIFDSKVNEVFDVSMLGDWALFFWRNRFTLRDSGGRLIPHERFRFVGDKMRAIDF